MNSAFIERFADSNKYFKCPVCSEPLFLREKSLVCENGHNFDIAKQGYVNLLRGGASSANYSAESFKNRRTVLEAGFYDHILSGLRKELSSLGAETALDAGCGEGYYAKALCGCVKKALAFDLSKESVALAARGDNRAAWFAADLADIPLLDRSVDVILNIFSPANYGEFKRLLRDGGSILKVIPGKNHLCELRERLKDELAAPDYSNERLIKRCGELCRIEGTEAFEKTFALSDELREAFLAMTPLMFGIERKNIDIEEITVSAVLIKAKPERKDKK